MWNVLHHENNENYVILYISQMSPSHWVRWELVMSPSWIFPAPAEPICECAEPSWGTSISELKPSWHFFDKSSKF